MELHKTDDCAPNERANNVQIKSDISLNSKECACDDQKQVDKAKDPDSNDIMMAMHRLLTSYYVDDQPNIYSNSYQRNNEDSLQNSRHFAGNRTLNVSNLPFSTTANELMDSLNSTDVLPRDAAQRVQLISHSPMRHIGKGTVLFKTQEIATTVLNMSDNGTTLEVEGRMLRWSRWKVKRRPLEDEEIQFEEEHDNIYNIRSGGSASLIFGSKCYPYCIQKHHSETIHSVAFDFSKRCIRARFMFGISYISSTGEVTPKAIEYRISFNSIVGKIHYYISQDMMIITLYYPFKKYKIYPATEYEDFDTEKSLCERAERCLCPSEYAQSMTIVIKSQSTMVIPHECFALLKRYNLLKTPHIPFAYHIISKRSHYSVSNPPEWVYSLGEHVRYLLSTLHSKQPAKLSYSSMTNDIAFMRLLRKYNKESRDLLCTALEYMFWDSSQGHYFDEPAHVLDYYISHKFAPRHSQNIEVGLGLIRHAWVSLSGIQTLPPYLETTNRVVRWYPGKESHFIRVTFCEDNGSRLHHRDALNVETRAWIDNILKNGITIGDRTYEFLAFGSSQLNEGSVWMFWDDGVSDITAESIRRRMGDFEHIKAVAKYAARMGQCFSTTVDSIKTNNIQKIKDITSPFVNNYAMFSLFEGVSIPDELIPSKQPQNICFSDGVGRMSLSFANKVSLTLGLSYTPSAYQIRYGGYKGMVAVHPECTHDLELRESMYKFESDDTMFEVCRYSFCSPLYLNRQIITLFETVNRSYSSTQILVDISKKCIDELSKMRMDRKGAISQLRLRSFNNNPLCPLYTLMQLLKHRIPMQHPFVSSAIEVFVRSELRDIQNRHRILIGDGASILGIMDEYAVLKPNEVFIQVQSPLINKGQVRIITGDVIITKCPALAPGDLRHFKAVSTNEIDTKLQHLKNVVVFSQQGTLSPTMQMAGSDLDGDVYWVTWSKELLSCFDPYWGFGWSPCYSNAKPFYFPSPKPKIVSKVTINDLQQFFVDYMQMDCLGMLAHSHLAMADQAMGRAKDKKCLILSMLNSYAVDYRKSGTPVDIKKILSWYGGKHKASLLPKRFPYFMRKYNSVYESQHALGQIYRNCKRKINSLYKKTGLNDMKFSECKEFDALWTVDGYETYQQDAFNVLEHYWCDIRAIMNRWQIDTEIELFMNMPLRSVKIPGLKDFDIKQKIKYQMNGLKSKYRAMFFDPFDDEDLDEKQNGSNIIIRHRFNLEMKRKASAWYIVTMKNISIQKKSNIVLTLPFIVFDVLCSIC
eukprot:455888_1